MRGNQALHPSSETCCENNVLFPFARMNESIQSKDIVGLKESRTEVIHRKGQKPCSILDPAVCVEPYKDDFQEFFRLCKTAVTVSTVCEHRV